MRLTCRCWADYQSPIFFCLRCGAQLLAVRVGEPPVLVVFDAASGPNPDWPKKLLLCEGIMPVAGVDSVHLEDGSLRADVRTGSGRCTLSVPAIEVYRCLLRNEQALSLR